MGPRPPRDVDPFRGAFCACSRRNRAMVVRAAALRFAAPGPLRYSVKRATALAGLPSRR